MVAARGWPHLLGPARGLSASFESVRIAWIALAESVGELATEASTSGSNRSRSARSPAKKHARQTASYLSAPPMSSTSSDVASSRRENAAGFAQPVQTAVSLTTSSARGTNSQTRPNA